MSSTKCLSKWVRRFQWMSTTTSTQQSRQSPKALTTLCRHSQQAALLAGLWVRSSCKPGILLGTCLWSRCGCSSTPTSSSSWLPWFQWASLSIPLCFSKCLVSWMVTCFSLLSSTEAQWVSWLGLLPLALIRRTLQCLATKPWVFLTMQASSTVYCWSRSSSSL